MLLKITNDRLQPFGNCDKTFPYYRMFAIGNFVLFAFRYLLFGMTCSSNINNE